MNRIYNWTSTRRDGEHREVRDGEDIWNIEQVWEEGGEGGEWRGILNDKESDVDGDDADNEEVEKEAKDSEGEDGGDGGKTTRERLNDKESDVDGGDRDKDEEKEDSGVGGGAGIFDQESRWEVYWEKSR